MLALYGRRIKIHLVTEEEKDQAHGWATTLDEEGNFVAHYFEADQLSTESESSLNSWVSFHTRLLSGWHTTRLRTGRCLLTGTTRQLLLRC
jgi:hypothetical protein